MQPKQNQDDRDHAYELTRLRALRDFWKRAAEHPVSVSDLVEQAFKAGQEVERNVQRMRDAERERVP